MRPTHSAERRESLGEIRLAEPVTIAYSARRPTIRATTRLMGPMWSDTGSMEFVDCNHVAFSRSSFPIGQLGTHGNG